MKPYRALFIILAILVLDQCTKVWVKTHMFLGEEIPITSWFSLHFTENPGMAFGMVLPGVWGKLFLSAFRLVAVGGGIWFIFHLIRQKSHWGFIAAASMILAGAIGNMIDGTFYGVIFSDSYTGPAKIFPERGYAGFLQGLVVDMAHVKLFTFHIPGWVPFFGDGLYEFFPFIFNVADSAITVGVFIILIFQGVFFKEQTKAETVLPLNGQNQTSAKLESKNPAFVSNAENK
jgi:signal peptidase II